MGITIHYSGKLDDPRVLPDLLTTARHFCFQRKWKYFDIDDRIIGKLEDGTPVDDVMRGVVIQPHPENESVWLTFNQSGELCFYHADSKPSRYWKQEGNFTKTQFAPIDVHMSICELLHLIRDKYFPGLEVNDEGEYWETGDPSVLADHLGSLNRLMDTLQQQFEKHDANASENDKIKFERGKKIKTRDPEWKHGHGRSAGRN
jgi:hypothetical protein